MSTEPPSSAQPAVGLSSARRRLLGLSMVWAILVFFYSAWISDDIMITLRQVWALGAGEGMVYNLGQRVQAFTHPTWFAMLSLLHVLTGSLYGITIGLSAVCSMLALFLYYRDTVVRVTPLQMTPVFLLLPLSSAGIVDYLGSGLENPLSFLLVALVLRLADRPRDRRTDVILWLLLATAVLTRTDHALQFGPVALWLLLWHGPFRQLGRAFAGILLLVSWYTFSTIYFGSPLPNTAFAKLSTGLPDAAVAEMARIYWQSALLDTPVTSAIILGGVLFGLLGRGVERAFALGIVLHLAYLNSIGGDFMQGRMLSVDAFISCFLLMRMARFIPVALNKLLFAGLIVAALFRTADTMLTIEPLDLKRVVDERKFYYPVYGLMSPVRNWPELPPAVPNDQVNRHVIATCGFLGGIRLDAPNSVWVADICGLADPFLARVPSKTVEEPRPGHMFRTLPAGYAEAVQSGRLTSSLTGVEQLFADTWIVSTGPIWDRERWRAIRRLHLHDYGIDPDPWRNPDLYPEATIDLRTMFEEDEERWLTNHADQPEVMMYPQLNQR